MMCILYFCKTLKKLNKSQLTQNFHSVNEIHMYIESNIEIERKTRHKFCLSDTMARIHKGGLSTNLGFRTSYDAFYAFFTNLVCKEQKEV